MKLHSKRLLSLWDKTTYDLRNTRHQKPIDGVFIFQSLFSVAAFASRNEQSVSVKLAQKTAEIMLEKLRTLRNDINLQRRTLLQSIGDIDINLPPSNEPQTVDTQPQQYTPENVMLIKVFLACDEYFLTLHKAKMNGEITEKELQAKRKSSVKQLIELLNSLNRTCISFHQVRKNAECQK